MEQYEVVCRASIGLEPPLSFAKPVAKSTCMHTTQLNHFPDHYKQVLSLHICLPHSATDSQTKKIIWRRVCPKYPLFGPIVVLKFVVQRTFQGNKWSEPY